MSFFTNKRIWQKIVIILLLVLFFQFALAGSVHAGVTSVILEPITGLLANLGDGIMEIMQKTFMGMESSGAWVEETNNIWLNILVAVVAIAAATIAVAATIASGGLALTVILAAAGAVIKIGAGAAVAFLAVNTLHLGESRFLFTRISTDSTSDF